MSAATPSATGAPFDPFAPGDTWARPRNKRAARTVDRLADAIDAEARANARMRRAFNAWDKARREVERLNVKLTREQEG